MKHLLQVSGLRLIFQPVFQSVFSLLSIISVITVLTVSLCASSYAFAYQKRYLQSGDHALGLLRKHGFTDLEREAISNQRSFADLSALTLNLENPYLVEVTKKKTELVFFDATKERAVKIIKINNKAVSVQALTNPYKKIKVQVSGAFRGSILKDVYEQTNSKWLASRLKDIYFTTNLQQLQSGKYQLQVEKLAYAGQTIRFGEILKSEIKSGNKKWLREYLPMKTGGVAINPKDAGLERNFFAPVTYLRIASEFLPNRLHPITGKHLPHLGVDFDIPIGTSIYAPRRGLVTRLGYQKGAGYYLMLRHSEGWESLYFHLQKPPRLRLGQKIEAGDPIAQSGNSGYSTSPHLHFALRKNGKFVNPLAQIKEYPKLAESKIQKRLAQN